MPLTLVSLIPESLTAVSLPLLFLTLTSSIITNIASLILSFIKPLKLTLTFLTGPPALISPLFSVALISPTLASPILVSPALISPALVSPALVSSIPVSPLPVSLILIFLALALIDYEQCLS